MSIFYCNECKDEAYVRFLRSGAIKDTSDKLVLTEDEAKSFWEMIKHQYISYEQDDQHALLKRLVDYLNERKKHAGR